MSKYDGIVKPGPLEKAVDAAIAEENAREIARMETPEYVAELEENGARWRAILAARETAGTHGVVLPVALAEDVLAALRGGSPRLGLELLGRMVEAELRQAADR